MLTLKECVGIDHLVSPTRPVVTPQSAPITGKPPGSGDNMPSSFRMAGPLNEAELTALLMASPLYQKMEQLKKAVSAGMIQTKNATPGK